DPYQHIGFDSDFNAPPWAAFSTFAGGPLYARTAGPGGNFDTLIPGNWLGAAHTFRIDWTASAINYFIDGDQVASHATTLTAAMRPLVSDLGVGGGNLQVDWMHMTPYVASGSFVSRVFDAG